MIRKLLILGVLTLFVISSDAYSEEQEKVIRIIGNIHLGDKIFADMTKDEQISLLKKVGEKEKNILLNTLSEERKKELHEILEPKKIADSEEKSEKAKTIAELEEKKSAENRTEAYSEEQEKVIGIVNFQPLKVGMSQDDVIKISGSPTLISEDDSGKPVYVYLRENLKATLTRTMKHNKDGSIAYENYLLMDTGTPSGFSIHVIKFDKNNMVESFKAYSDAEIPKKEAERGAIKIAVMNLVDKDGKPLKEELKIGMTQAKVTEILGSPKLISKNNNGKDLWIYLYGALRGQLKPGRVDVEEWGIHIEIIHFDKNSLVEPIEEYSFEF